MAADPLPTVPGPALPAAPATMLELGAALGADVWWCEQLFAVAGGWVATTPEGAIRIHGAELSRVAGEHAQVLRALLPRPAPVDPVAWVTPPSDAATDVVAELAEATESSARLAVVHRVVLSRLLAGWAPAGGLSVAGPARALRHARADLADLRDEGEALLQALVATDPRHLDAAHAAARRAEGLLVTRGGMRPPVPSAPPI
ncbi:MAG TPA: hypothetical protein VF228_08820 [Iamia sp.]